MLRRFGPGAHLVNAISFAAATVTPIMNQTAAPNDAILYLMRDLLPNGLLGVAIAGLLAAFMAGMAANISAFNTVISYDICQAYLIKDRDDDFYLKFGRWATVAAAGIAVFTALIANNFGNVMDYLQTLFGFFNAPLFATFILGMFWKRMTPTAGWVGLVMGTLPAIVYWYISTFTGAEAAVFNLPGQGTAFVAASVAFVIDMNATPEKNASSEKKAAGAFDVRNIIGMLLGIYGIVLLLSALLLDPGINPDTGLPKDASYNTWTGLALVVAAAVFLTWAKLRPIIVPADPEAPADAVKEA